MLRMLDLISLAHLPGCERKPRLPFNRPEVRMKGNDTLGIVTFPLYRDFLGLENYSKFNVPTVQIKMLAVLLQILGI